MMEPGQDHHPPKFEATAKCALAVAMPMANMILAIVGRNLDA